MTWQIMSEATWTTFGTVEAPTYEEALDVWAVSQGYIDWCDYSQALGITNKPRIHEGFRIYI